MATGLIDIMKRAAMDANEASQYTDIREGTVVKVNPLEIKISQNFILPASMIIVPESLSNYTISVQTEGEEIMTIFVQNDLELNDKVILLRAHGGKQYIVLDKVKET